MARARSPMGRDVPIPIKHVVVIVKENHTFDNYFGSFPGAEGTTTCKQVDGEHVPLPARAGPHVARPLPRAQPARSPTGTTARWTAGTCPAARRTTATTSRTRSTTKRTSRTTGSTRATSRSPITSSPNVLGPSFPGHIVRARRAGRLGARQPDTTGVAPVLGLRSGRRRRTVDVQDQTTVHG